MYYDKFRHLTTNTDGAVNIKEQNIRIPQQKSVVNYHRFQKEDILEGEKTLNVYTALQLKEFVLQVFDVNFGELPNKGVRLCHFYISHLFLGMLGGEAFKNLFRTLLSKFNYEWNSIPGRQRNSMSVHRPLSTGQDFISKRTQGLLIEQCHGQLIIPTQGLCQDI